MNKPINDKTKIITLLKSEGENELDFLSRCQYKAISVNYKKLDFDGDRCIIYYLTLPNVLKTVSQ